MKYKVTELNGIGTTLLFGMGLWEVSNIVDSPAEGTMKRIGFFLKKGKCVLEFYRLIPELIEQGVEGL